MHLRHVRHLDRNISYVLTAEYNLCLTKHLNWAIPSCSLIFLECGNLRQIESIYMSEKPILEFYVFSSGSLRIR